MTPEGPSSSLELCSPYPSPSLSSKTVLVAEDDEWLRAALVRDLQNWGYRVVDVEDGLELLDYLEGAISKSPRWPLPSVIIAELTLPGCGGLQIRERLTQQVPPIPLILLSSEEELDARPELESSDSFFIATKPFDLGEIQDLLVLAQG